MFFAESLGFNFRDIIVACIYVYHIKSVSLLKLMTKKICTHKNIAV